jgi:hypothetical protein
LDGIAGANAKENFGDRRNDGHDVLRRPIDADGTTSGILQIYWIPAKRYNGEKENYGDGDCENLIQRSHDYPGGTD